MKILIACEFSGTVRDAFAKLGHDAWSCDLFPCDPPSGKHIKGDVTPHLTDWWDMMIAHPPCTYLTCSAEWAYADPDYVRYPGVGYHQKVKPGTLVGAARREARRQAVEFCRLLLNAPIPRIALENPRGHLSSAIRKPNQTIQPYDYGDDASKATCLWLKNLPPLKPTKIVEPRIVNGKKRWGNQTDSGQNNLSPSDDRWALRSLTYQGIADAMAAQWGNDGWEVVRMAAEMPVCECCGDEAYCEKHGMHFADCSCFGPTQDGIEYKQSDGVMYGRLRAAK